MTCRVLSVLILFTMTAASTIASAATYHVGPGKRYASLLAVSARPLKAGDQVFVYPGAKQGGTVNWNAKGVKGRPVVIRGVPEEGKKYVEIFLGEKGVNYRDRVNVFNGCEHMLMENLRFYGAAAHNFQKNGSNGERVMLLSGCTDITLRNCRVDHNLSQGVVGGGKNILIENCELDHNGMLNRYGRGAPYYHNTYWHGGGHITMPGCYVYGAYAPPGQDDPADKDSGQCLKSRATYLRLESCLVVSAYNDALDLVNSKEPQTAEIIGCVIVKGERKRNSRFCTMGADSGAGGDYKVTVINTTFVQRHGGVTISPGRGTLDLTLINCAFTSADGKGGKWDPKIRFSGTNNYFQSGLKPPPGVSGSMTGGAIRFVGADKFDYRIPSGSPLANRGAADGFPKGMALPKLHYVHPMKTVQRPDDGRPDIGAYEFGTLTATASRPKPKTGAPVARPAKRKVDPAIIRKSSDELVAQVVSSVSAGKRARVYVEFLGRSTRAKVISASKDEVVVSIMGNPTPYAWKTLKPPRLYGIARRCLNDSAAHRSALARYCAAAGLDEQLAEEMSALRQADPSMASVVRKEISAY